MTESIQILMEKDRLQPLADNIKVLKGSDSITLQQMEDTIEETNTDIVSQTDLIAQLASALRGKSVPGGGSQEYKTCTVGLVVPEDPGQKMLIYTTVRNGQLYVETDCPPFHPALRGGMEVGSVRNLDVVIGTPLLLGFSNLTSTQTSYKVTGDCDIMTNDGGWEKTPSGEWRGYIVEGSKMGCWFRPNGDCTIET